MERWIAGERGGERRSEEEGRGGWRWEEREERERRKWGRGQWLCFPRGAEVVDVVVAFCEGGREWCWGSYSGVGGLFPREKVRLVEEDEGEGEGEGEGVQREEEIGVAVGM